jgi:hypothetical protein
MTLRTPGARVTSRRASLERPKRQADQEATMALPGRDKTFAFESCRDMLDKLEREIDRYARVDGKDVEAMKDLAFNIAVTAWHLCDWAYMDLKPEQRDSLHIHSLGEMHERAFTCRALYVFRQVATASKHWAVTKR